MLKGIEIICTTTYNCTVNEYGKGDLIAGGSDVIQVEREENVLILRVIIEFMTLN